MKHILFNTEMVRAVQEERKGVTRRAIKPAPAGDGSKPEPLITRPGYWNTWGDDMVYRQPYQPGDILWVRETWRMQNYGFHSDTRTYDGQELQYRADFTDDENECYGRRGGCAPCKWRPSIHMPREAARLFLRVTGVRVERLRDMTLADVLMEGIREADTYEGTWDRWHDIWNSTIRTKDIPLFGWEANPWVWVIAFERISKEAALGGGGDG